MTAKKPTSIVKSFERFLNEGELSVAHINLPSLPKHSGQEPAPSFVFDNTRFVLLNSPPSDDDLDQYLRECAQKAFAPNEPYDLVFVDTSGRNANTSTRLISRGVSYSGLHAGIARLLGLPTGWRETQEQLIAQTLAPLRHEGGYRIAVLYACEADNKEPAQEWLAHRMDPNRKDDSRLIYIRAEAGKGKSTILAHLAYSRLVDGVGPLPLYIPLRLLQRGAGISWDQIAASVGVVGPAATTLAAAVRAGLVTLSLDGLDEVAGRYDLAVVQSVIQVISKELLGPWARIVLSGRTTESSLLHQDRTLLATIDLPDPDEPAFTTYAESVVDATTPGWPSLARLVPEPPYQKMALPLSNPTASDQERIVEWIQRVFEDLGKERSLFFVQSLACIGRTYQLDGNRPLVIENAKGGAQLADAKLYDVCILATALACIREQDKIETLATTIFSPSNQLELLSCFALRASAETSFWTNLPTSQELTQHAFSVDPTNQNEEFTALSRQMQKHALLFSGPGTGIRAGDWTPQFLSDWVRCALICRAWTNRRRLSQYVSEDSIVRAVARAQRAQEAYRVLVPELITTGGLRDLDVLWAALNAGISEDLPEASANAWFLYAALPEAERSMIAAPSGLAPLTDLGGAEFNGIGLGKEFSGTLISLADAHFINCTLVGVDLSSVDMTGAQFSGCRFSQCRFSYNDGPVVFDECQLTECQLIDGRSQSGPAFLFYGCAFSDNTSITQNRPLSPRATYGPCAEFEDCIWPKPISDLISGDFCGIVPSIAKGISAQVLVPSSDKAVACLKALLKPFFPRQAGASGQLQVRGYIRSSAVGRGLIPENAPDSTELVNLLTSMGFTTGGREGHIYAPWSKVAGGGGPAMVLRNELLTFMVRGTQSEVVRKLLGRLRELTDWE